jgi:hypothetical protein
MDFITAEQIIEKEKKGFAVHVYPRKHIVCISGFQYYKVNHRTVLIYKYYKKHGVICQER